MDVAAVLSVLGQGFGWLTPQAAGADASSDAGPGFGDTFDDLAETSVRAVEQGDPAGGADADDSPPEPAALAETVLFFPIAARLIPDLAAGTAEGHFLRAIGPTLKAEPEGASSQPSVTPAVPHAAEGAAVALPVAPDNSRQPQQTAAEEVKTLKLPDRQGDRPVENAPSLVESAAPDPDAVPATKGPALPQPLDAAAQEQIPPQPLQHLPEGVGQGHGMARAPSKEKPLIGEDVARTPRRQDGEVPLRAGPPDRPLPAGLTDPAGVPEGDARQKAVIAFVSRPPTPLPAEPASGSAPDAGRGQEVGADAEGVLTGSGSPEGKATLQRPKGTRPLPEGAQAVSVRLSDGGPGLSHALPSGPDLTGAHAPRPFDPGASHIAHSPHAIGMQLADRMPATAGPPIEITLAPEELGKVRMTLSASDGALTLQLVADRPETLDLMRRHVDQLAQDFRDMGFERLSFTFGQGQKGNQQPQQPAPTDPPKHESPSQGVTPTAGSAHRPAPVHPFGPDDRLDLRF